MKHRSPKFQFFNLLLIGIFLSFSAFTSAGLKHVGNDSSLAALKTELERLGELSGGVLGVSVIHLETGVGVDVRGEERFPMASTYKVPTAVTLLKQVDQGKRRLTDVVEIKEEFLVPSDGITAHFLHPGIKLSLRNLLEPMLIVSDNTATDVLMAEVGGSEKINATLKKLGVSGIRVSRDTARLIRDYFEVEQPPVGTKRSLLQELNTMSPEDMAKWDTFRSPTFADDPRDTATPNGMASLLKAIWQGDALSRDSTEIIQDIMLRCRTGEKRLKGILPAATPVAHKTGTIGGTTNDVGVITLPNNRGHLVVAAFIKKSVLNDYAIRDRAIAEAARAAHDYFSFNVVNIANR